MDTTQEELVAALVRRLQGRAPRHSAATTEVDREPEVIIELDPRDDELVTLD